MRAYVLLNLLNELGKRSNARLAKQFFPRSLKMIQEHEC